MKDKNDKVICVYDEKGKDVQEVIFEAFEKFLKIKLKNNSFSVSNKKGNDKNDNEIFKN